MAEQSAVPMIVLTRHQDNVEAINSTLRNAGLAVRCNWIRELNDLGEALAQINAHMLVAFVGQDPGDIAKVMSVSKQFGPEVPVLIARDQLDEESIASAMQHGARDAVTLMNPLRLKLVVARELEAHNRAQTLARTISSATEYRDQLKSFMAGSADAIAHVQEGIVVDANPAWLDLYGLPDADALVGTPLMDAFDAEAHAAIKGALVACLQGKWSNHSLRANALLSDGSNLPLEIELSRADFEGDPAVRLCVASTKRDAGTINEQLTDALERDAATGALQRRFFLQQLQQSLSQPIKAGIRQLVAIQPDKLDGLTEDVGPLAIEEVIGQFAGLIAETRQANDLFGRFGDGTFVLLMERGTQRDVEIWASNLIKKVAGQVFRAGDKQTSCTCSVGIGMIDIRTPDAARSLNDAMAARRNAEAAGGGRVAITDTQDEDTRQQAADAIWVRYIRAALMENRFRLMQQPIASLMGEDRGMFDVLVRMVDEQGAGGAAVGVHGGGRAQRPDEEYRPLGHRRVDDVLRQPAGEVAVRATVQGFGPRQVVAAVAAEPAEGDARRPAAHRVPGQRAGRDGVPGRRDRPRVRTASRRFPLRAGAFRRRPRSAAPARASAGGLHQGRRHVDAGIVRGSGTAAARARPGRAGEGQEGRDDCRARRGREHHGGAVAARHRVHPGVFRQRAGVGDDLESVIPAQAGSPDGSPRTRG